MQTERKERIKPIICDRCGGTDFQKRGTDLLVGGKVQRYQCKGCGKITPGEWIEPQEVTAAVNLKK